MKRSITLKFLPYLLPVLLLATISSCKKDENNKLIVTAGKYENGFFILNEGSYQTLNGNVSYFDYGTGKLTDSAFTKENPDKSFAPNTTSLESGTIFNHKIYLLVKGGGPLVVTDELTLKETGRIAASMDNDWRSFIALDNNNGLVSTAKGIYPLNLSTLALGTKIAGVDGEVGDMIKAGNYIFVLSQTDGVVILKADFSIAKKIADLDVAFAKGKDGSIWAAGSNQLVSIDPVTLTVKNIAVPFVINGSWGAWHTGSITASTTDDAIFLAKNEQYNGGTEIYKYTATNAASFTTPFIKIPDGKEMYGQGISYNAKLNQLIVTTVKSGYGENFKVNDLYFYDTATGAQKADVAYTGLYFPAMPLFHQ
ncbi:protein of unknown function [Mucilaginibacter pineti]|uniref:DUF5074 domain-containing protein n=1 Tax=Mucilaginibacter pineti TaxID=1391627 RepID=A0A1G6T264_9SPHI|nr:DUF5074 domain-containing protein [Mucilaginibacter pineti]SDD22944.1 protein of unknown function [Mucilaginibacter pineti]